MLIIVDPQVDFVTGSLAVPGAVEAMEALAHFIRNNPERYSVILVTSDWHPADHSSFDVNGGQWPVHCVADTPGAAVTPVVQEALQASRAEVITIFKGEKTETEEYSAFTSRRNAERIKLIIERYGIDHIDVCGLAGDYCVLATLSDGIDLLGYDYFHVLTEYSPSIDGGTRLNKFLADLPCDR